MSMPSQPGDLRVELLRRALSRRGFLASAGAVGVGGLLGACGTSSSGGSATATPSFAADTSATDKIVRWANWTLYLDYDDQKKVYPTLVDFEKKTGLKVTYREDIDDNDTFWGKVNGQLTNGDDIGYDIVTPTDWMVGRWIRLGYAQPFENVPNTKNLLASLQDVPFDKGHRYSATWQSGLAGLAWDKTKVPGGLKSIEDLFDPKLQGKVTVLSEFRDTLGLLMMYQGKRIDGEITDEQFTNALDLLDKQLSDGQIYKVQGNSYKEDLVSGKAWAGIVWSGDIFQLNAENNDRWGFALPDSGGTLWSDNMLIPSTSPHKANAEKLINYYLQPDVAAEVAAYVNYICPVEGAQAEMEKIDPELAASEFIFPSAATLANTQAFGVLSAEQEQSFTKQWLEVIGS